MIRITPKCIIIYITSIITIATVYKLGQCDQTHRDHNFYRDQRLSFQPRVAQSFSKESQSSSIECVVNGEKSYTCRREGNAVFMPFSFIQKYFEVYGSIESYDGYERFEFHHSYSNVHPKPAEYSPGGAFMSFELSNVEDRNRVKCLSGQYGVPISTQWSSKGHFYPIQIAQFGLSHYSKYLTEPTPQVRVVEDGESGDTSQWLLPDRKSQLVMKTDERFLQNSLLEFDSPGTLKSPGITVSLDEEKLMTLSLDVKFITNGSLTVTLRAWDGSVFKIHYVPVETVIRSSKKEIFIGLGTQVKGQWFHMTRIVINDFLKGIRLQMSKSKFAKVKRTMQIVALSFRGHGFIDNITLSSTAHLDHFFNAANYLLNHQDYKGGWPIMVQRRLIPGVLELDPGWYSAMGQGQSISLLVRAYIVSKEVKYLRAAEKALNVFDINSTDGGVKATFAGVYDWYEEYPTIPSSYVLNGFIYSLLGLFDLKETSTGNGAEHASRLYENGMKSLKNMLLMFDTGSGTFYDLRHLSLGVAPNRARWDYHTVHINQLHLLSLIDGDSLFSATAMRWTDYMKGKVSSHN